MTEYIVLLVSAVAVAAGAWHLWSPGARKQRDFRKAKPVLIRDTADGVLVKLVGRIVIDGDLGTLAPLTQRPCAAHTVEVKSPAAVSQTRHSWVTVFVADGTAEFELEDSSGRALIRPQGTRLEMSTDTSLSSSESEPATPEMESLLAAHGVEMDIYSGIVSFRYREGILAAGQHVALLGVAKWEVAPTAGEGGGYRGQAKRLVITDVQMLSDHPG